MRVTVAGALPRTDIGVHPVAEDTLDGHDTAIKGAVTDGMKRAFRSFGVQFGNGFYGDQPQAGNPPQPQRVPAQANGNSGQANRSSGQAQGRSRSESQIEKLRKRLIEIAAEQGLDEDQVRTRRRGPDGQEPRRPGRHRARAAGGGRRQQAPADAAGPGRLVCRSIGFGIESGAVSFGGLPRSFITGQGGYEP